jgi:hypothetical protein
MASCGITSGDEEEALRVRVRGWCGFRVWGTGGFAAMNIGLGCNGFSPMTKEGG